VYHVLNSERFTVHRFVIVLVLVVVLVPQGVVRPQRFGVPGFVVWKEKGDPHSAPLLARPTRSCLPFGRGWVFLLVTRNLWSIHNERSSSKRQTSTGTLEDEDDDEDENDWNR
jgi:hypothetical protein